MPLCHHIVMLRCDYAPYSLRHKGVDADFCSQQAYRVHPTPLCQHRPPNQRFCRYVHLHDVESLWYAAASLELSSAAGRQPAPAPGFRIRPFR